MPSEQRHTFCRLCEVMCGLTVTVSDGAIEKVRADSGHPVSAGFACNKGLLSLEVHRDPDRLDVPVSRDGQGFSELSWSDATTRIAERLGEVIDRHGPGAVALYLGNPNAFNPLAGPAAAMFLLSLGGDKIFSAATQDCSNKFTVSEILYGSTDLHPVADLATTDHLLLLGTNPRISKSSFISQPDPIRAVREVVERGGTVTFVNPLAIEADIGETVQVRPDTDAFLLAAMLHHIERTAGFDLDRYGDRVHNTAPLRRWLADYSPERVAPVAGVGATVIQRLAEDFAAARTAAVHASTGVNMGRNGALAYYLVQMLSLVTGNLDRPGGNVAAQRAVAPMGATLPPGPESFEDTPWGPVRRSKGSLPAALLPDWIRHEKEPIRALISVAGNPVLSLAGGSKVGDALGELDLLVAIDLYRNATAELADFVLPATDWYERADLNAFTQGIQTRPHVQVTEAVVEPKGERRHETEIFAMLAEAMGGEPLLEPGLPGLAAVYDAELGAHGLSVARLAARDRGVAVLDPGEPGDFMTERLMTPERRIDCSPALLVDAMASCDAAFEDMRGESPGQLRLITRRTRNTLNSAMANIAVLKGRGASENPIWMNPDDAAARGLAEGDNALLSSGAGSVSARVRLDPALRDGVVAMTHGFGFAANPGMPTAQAHPGVNVNELSAVGPGSFDPLSGMSQLTGIPVEVHAAG